MRVWVSLVMLFLAVPVNGFSQDRDRCRVLCAPELSVQPTATVNNVFAPARIIRADGTPQRQQRATEFDMVVSVDLPTRISWLEFTIEASVAPFESDNTPELEFEVSLTWLAPERTRRWISSHVDLVDSFSAAGRPADHRAYTHKLDIEAAIDIAVFKWLSQTRWLRSVQVEAALDYLATGLPRSNDVIDGVRFVDKMSPWSFSLAVVLPMLPQ